MPLQGHFCFKNLGAETATESSWSMLFYMTHVTSFYVKCMQAVRHCANELYFVPYFCPSKHWMVVADSLSHEIEHDPVVVSSDQSSVARADILECCSSNRQFFPSELVCEALARLYAELSFCICNMTANQLPKLYIYSMELLQFILSKFPTGLAKYHQSHLHRTNSPNWIPCVTCTWSLSLGIAKPISK